MSLNISLVDVSKAFDGKAVLRNYSLTLAPGKATCLMGPSGIGKTTVMNLFLGSIRPESGQVFAPKRMSAVFQEDRLLDSFSALVNLQLVTGHAQKAQNLALLRQLRLQDAGQQPVSTFSGGMRRRVAIARALAVDFDFLLLDEPFKGLDEDMKAQVARVILERAAGKTVLLISHDIKEAALLNADLVHF